MVEAYPLRHFDIAIVGYGPVGATLAGLLGRQGLQVGVFEKSATIFAQPRAVGFDHDAMRIFQRIGIAQQLGPHIASFRDAEYFGADGQVIQRSRHMAPPYPFTWSPNYTCDQPGVEAILRQAIGRMANVQVALEHECIAAREEAERVLIDVRDRHQQQHRYSARYLVACDGASSPVRRMLGIELESMEYDEPWIVVDLKVEPAFLDRLPATNVQYCEPERPSTFIICPGNHRRWEFMVLDGEPREGALSDERLWRLLARWLKPGQASIWRAAAYRFHALIAHDWRRGRMFLAGDSAHQTPPFLGQGMCQGLRDAGNLAWKLGMAIRGQAGPSLLDTYTEERRPHVLATTRIAKELGRMISERDPARARARDAQMLAKGGGMAPTLIRQEMIPGLSQGLIAAGAPLAGLAFPQPVVATGEGQECLLDDLTGPCFRLVVNSACDSHALRTLAAAHGVSVIVLGGVPVTSGKTGDVLQIAERDGLIKAWLDGAGTCGALVRPDHYVFGAFATVDQALALIDALAASGLMGEAQGATQETSDSAPRQAARAI